MADYADQAYYKDEDSLYVVLFTPSTVRWELDGTAVMVQQRTSFPESPRVDLTVSVSRPTRFSLKVRTPSWLAGPVIAEVNGDAVDVETSELHWMVFDREWRDSDRLSITLPMALWVSRLDPGKSYPAAIMHGPVTMAVAVKGNPWGNPSGKIDLADLDGAFVRSHQAPLTWHLASDPGVILKPFYAFGEKEPYFLYLDPSRLDRIRLDDITFAGEWHRDGRLSCWSGLAGATAACTFEGTGIRWLGFRVHDGGMAEVFIDGRSMGIVDQYGPGWCGEFDCEYRGLPPGRHTITIEVVSDKNPQSNGTNVNVAAFQVCE